MNFKNYFYLEHSDILQGNKLKQWWRNQSSIDWIFHLMIYKLSFSFLFFIFCSLKVECTSFSRSSSLCLLGNHHLPNSNPENYKIEITMKARLQPKLILQQEKVFKTLALKIKTMIKNKGKQGITHIQKKYVISNAFWTCRRNKLVRKILETRPSKHKDMWYYI